MLINLVLSWALFAAVFIQRVRCFDCYECSGSSSECANGGDPALLVRSCIGNQKNCFASYSKGALVQRACYELKPGDQIGCVTNAGTTVCICTGEACNNPAAFGPTQGLPPAPPPGQTFFDGVREAALPNNTNHPSTTVGVSVGITSDPSKKSSGGQLCCGTAWWLWITQMFVLGFYHRFSAPWLV